MTRHATGRDDSTPQAISALRRRLYSSLSLLVLVVIVSSAGFYLLERPHESVRQGIILGLWETLNLISTVGNLPAQMTDGRRIWAMLVIAFGLGFTLYAFGNLIALLTSGEILHVFETRRMERQITSSKDHVIICGYGNTGRLVAEQLASHAVPLIIIEREQDLADTATHHGYPTIRDDCTQEAVLRKARIDRARGLVATLDNDASNVFVVLTARGLSPDLHIVSRANLPETVSQLERAGANQVAVPSRIAAQQLANAVIRPELDRFVQRAIHGQEVEMLEVRISDYPAMAGRSLRDLNLPRAVDLLVFAMIPKGGTLKFNPEPDTVVNLGDLLLTAARKGALERLQPFATAQPATDSAASTAGSA